MDTHYPITVDYNLRLKRMIKDSRYDWKDSDINAKNFPVEGKGTAAVDIELIHFNRDMESDDVLKELDEQGLRLATLPELLAFGATYPDKQRRKFPIVALGSVWESLEGYRSVACLDGDDSKRRLRLAWPGDGWLAFCRFAAVRK